MMSPLKTSQQKMPRSRKQQIDPTGQRRNVVKSTRRLEQRLASAQRRVLALFRNIPRKRRQKKDIANVLMFNRTIYDYQISAEEMDRLRLSIVGIFTDELMETLSPAIVPFGWYWEQDIEQPFRQGTIDEINSLNRVIAAATAQGILVDGLPIATLSAQQVLLSEPHRQAVAKAVGDNFQIIKTLSERSAQRTLLAIENGILGGVTPSEIRDTIKARFQTSVSDAQRIARTEIPRAYNNAKIEVGRVSGARIGVKTAVLHISALLPDRTRPTHARRHGNLYTAEAQLQWWDMGANRINCLCTTETVIVDRRGRLMDKRFQNELKAEKQIFNLEEDAA